MNTSIESFQFSKTNYEKLSDNLQFLNWSVITKWSRLNAALEVISNTP